MLSGELKTLCTPNLQKYLRQIDCVVVKGASKPVDLFTCDVEVRTLKTEKFDPLRNKSKQDRKMLIVRKRIERNRFKQ